MTYQEEKQVRLRRQGSKHAISLAMQGRWREAIAVNNGLIESFPHDVDAFNRLGKAYVELGEYSQAKEAYARAVELDPYNVIAKKNLHRLSHLGEGVVSSEESSQKVELQHFIEEVGKAKVVNLHSVAPPEVLARMVAGDEVYLKIESSKIIVENIRGEYLGYVEPRHGHRLIKLMEGGNTYAAAVVSLAVNEISVIIREVYQDPSQAGRLSFTSQRFEEVQPYVSDRVFKRESDYEGEFSEVTGYAVSGGEKELPSEELDEVGGDKLDDDI